MNSLGTRCFALTLWLLAVGCSAGPETLRPQEPAATTTTENSSHDLLSLSGTEQSWLAEHVVYGLPKYVTPATPQLIVREGYVLSHNSKTKIADWVAYHLTASFATGTDERSSSSAFKPDPLLPIKERAELSDYRGSGFDRGHQCPAGDSRGRGADVMRESFYLSNMTPQNATLNRGQWRALEERVRRWAVAGGELWVITGPVYQAKEIISSVMGANSVAVPAGYFKIVLRRNTVGELEALTFLMPNAPISALKNHLVSIDTVEALVGLDVLHELDDVAEIPLEAKIQQTLWP